MSEREREPRGWRFYVEDKIGLYGWVQTIDVSPRMAGRARVSSEHPGGST